LRQLSFEGSARQVSMGMLQDHIRNTQWEADLFHPALYHSKWTIGIGNSRMKLLAESDP
jgi:hypothetical protein